MTAYTLSVLNTISAAPGLGDHSHTVLYVVLAIVAAGCAGVLMFFSKKK